MFEKVSPSHPDKVCDRIAGAIVDLAYKILPNPTVAVEVLLGHGHCTIQIESSVTFENFYMDIREIVYRITGDANLRVFVVPVAQDGHLYGNQMGKVRCGDNGIFKGVPCTEEEWQLTGIVEAIYAKHPYDGKAIITGDPENWGTVCWSNVKESDIRGFAPRAKINPLGEWTGGPSVDAGATNRKLGSDMAQSITGGGLHGKDLSKADVSVNIYAWLKAQQTGEPVELTCSIGDETVDGKSYSEVVEIARKYIEGIGGFEKFAEWGLVR